MLSTVCNNFLVCSVPYWLWAGVSDKHHKAFTDKEFNKLISFPFCLQAWACIHSSYTCLIQVYKESFSPKIICILHSYPHISIYQSSDYVAQKNIHTVIVERVLLLLRMLNFWNTWCYFFRTTRLCSSEAQQVCTIHQGSLSVPSVSWEGNIPSC